MRKRSTYRMVPIKDVKLEKLKEVLAGQKVTVAVDNAKEVPVAAVMKKADEVLLTMKWKQPSQTLEVVELFGSLGASQVQVAMEPSGTYGDALRAQLWAAGMEVYRVSSKRVHDLAEVHDGVPSHHDAKSAAIIGKLHLEGRSERWALRSERERDAVAAVKLMGLYEEQLQRGKGQLEALLARHWPELDGLLELGTATQLGLLRAYGSAAAVAADAEGAAALMGKLGGWRLSQKKVAAVLEAAGHSTGLEPTEMERVLIMELCAELERARQLEAKARARVHKLLAQDKAVQQMAEAVGTTTAAVLYAELGDPRSYERPAQYVKSLGLNLKEKSSGKSKGAAHITKRGSSTARQYLYLAAMRKVKDCEVVRAWFERKQRRDGGKGKGGKGIVAIMRKLAAALWHVARGAAFDAAKLYDVQALGLLSGPRPAKS
jgi:transposase